MDFSEEVKPLIEADANGNISYDLVRGGTVILTDRNIYIIEENVLGELESFRKILNEEVNSINVKEADDLTDILQAPITQDILGEFEDEYEESKINQEIIRELVSERDLDPYNLSRVINRDEPATMFRVHLDKRAPTVYIDSKPQSFVKRFLESEAYRENYIKDQSSGV